MLTKLFAFALCMVVTSVACAAEMAVTIRTDFPGGNLKVIENQGSKLIIAPDLRDTKNSWFYWYFEAEASIPGEATFSFAYPGNKSGTVGRRGPAISTDGGQTWQWGPAENFKYADPALREAKQPAGDEFTYHFTEAKQRVRFSVGIPYLQNNLDAFLKANTDNKHLKRSVVTKSRGGRDVDLLQIGQEGPGVQPVMFTARHHACEAMASYVLEGLLSEAMSESPAAVAFRKKFVIFCVPIVDKDGVEQGDQGKNRSPHDHNRDYGNFEPIYPEVKAIQKLGTEKDIHYMMDFHCPALRGDIHDAFHFLGAGSPLVIDNGGELGAWMKEEGPGVVNAPLNLLKPFGQYSPDAGIPSAYWFSYRKGAVMAISMETPYANDIDVARQVGAGIIRSFARMHFLEGELPVPRTAPTDFAALKTLRDEYKLQAKTPADAAEWLRGKVADPQTPPACRVEANIMLASTALRLKDLLNAFSSAGAAATAVDATKSQRAAALAIRIQALSASGPATPGAIDAALAEFAKVPYPSKEQSDTAIGAARRYFYDRKDYEKAIALAREQFKVIAGYQQGRTLNDIAAMYDLLGQPDKANAARQEAIALLKKQMDPAAVSIMSAYMRYDYFMAVNQLPTSTQAEREAAAKFALEHGTLPADLRKQIEEAMKVNRSK